MKRQTATMTRRDFLQFAGKTAAVSAGALLTGCAQTAMQSSTKAGGGLRAIDIHHHYIPLELIDEVKRNGKALGVEYFPGRPTKTILCKSNFPRAIDSTRIHAWRKSKIASTL
jgi:hypothetical protein